MRYKVIVKRYKATIKAEIYMSAENKKYAKEAIKEIAKEIETDSMGNYSIRVEKLKIKIEKLAF